MNRLGQAGLEGIVSPKASNNLYGNLDLLILRTVEVNGPVHGLGAMDAILRNSDGTIEVEDGALYRSLHRLEARGFLTAEWRTSDNNRRAKFYALTKAGKTELDRAKAEWERHTKAVGRVLGVGWESTP
jgi:PadR family transcriptional regulator PadR